MRDLLLLLLLLMPALPLPANEAAGASPAYAAGLGLYERGDFKGAVTAFERAAALEPENDVYAYWLGKACGRVAERAGALSAMRWAGRTRDALERAVELNPDNPDAVLALAQFYEEAPRFIGGNEKKAGELRAHLAELESRAAEAEAVTADKARIPAP
jgi:tetratricopeptide (TPR) repeat protein